jgi:hypothetical protein
MTELIRVAMAHRSPCALGSLAYENRQEAA